jgi:MCP family monocarboxylic acid transporter-like MFS transporter 10
LYPQFRIAKDIGVPPSKGSFLVGFMCMSQTVGKIACGKFADLRCANRLLMAQLSLLVIAVGGCLLPLATSYSALVTYAIVQGFFDGCYVVLIGLITHDIVGKELMADAVGSVYFMISIPMTMGPPVAGKY